VDPRVDAHAVSRAGRERRRNEDMVLLDELCLVYIVADGLGGMPAGEVASEVAVECIGSTLESDGCEALSDLPAVCREAHEAVKEVGRDFGGAGIATTLTLAHLRPRTLRVAHVGDSRAFLIRGGRCIALTSEHRVGVERVDLFDVFPPQGSSRGPLTRALGQDRGFEVDLVTHELRDDDCIVLATDGLTDLVATEEIGAVVDGGFDSEGCCEALLQLAVGRGAADDVSIVVIRVEDAGRLGES
jgi:protein phosphatase